MPPEISPELLTLITIPEACKLWKKGDKTIRMAIDKGYLDARKSFRCWLITRASLEARWGKPQRDLLETLFN